MTESAKLADTEEAGIRFVEGQPDHPLMRNAKRRYPGGRGVYLKPR